MGSIATIPLMGTPMPDPAITAGRVVALRNLQAQGRQDDLMNPLRVQEAQQVIQQHQLANQQAQENAKIGAVLRDSQAEFTQKDADWKRTHPTPAVTPPAAPAAPPPVGATAPISALAATTGDPAAAPAFIGPIDPASVPPVVGAAAPAPEAMPSLPASPDAAPAWNQPAQPISGLGTATAAPAATAAPNRNDIITRNLTSAGLGQHAPRVLQDLAISQESQLRASAMQRDQDDDEKAAKAWNDVGGDMEKWLPRAAALGMSSIGQSRLQQNQTAIRTNIAKQHETEANAGIVNIKAIAARHDMLADRLTGFVKRPDDDSDGGQSKNYVPVMRAALQDKLITTQEFNDHMKEYSEHPGSPTITQWINVLRSSAGLHNGAAADSQQANAAKLQKDALVTQLYGAKDAATYDKILKGSSVPQDDLPTSAQMFDAKTGKQLPDQFKALNSLALTSEQRQTAMNVADTRKGAEALLGERVRHDQAMEANTANKNDKETPAARKTRITNLAYEALQHSKDGGGGSFAQAKADVNNPSLYQGHAIESVRGEVAQRLEDMQQQQGKEAATERQGRGGGNKPAAGMSTLETMKWKRAHPGEPVPTSQPAAAPPVQQAAPAAAPVAAAPAAAKPPAAAPPSQLHLNPSTGQIAELVNGKWEIRQGTKSGSGYLDPKTKQVVYQ